MADQTTAPPNTTPNPSPSPAPSSVHTHTHTHKGDSSPKKKDATPPVSGRTWPDVASDALKSFGIGAPFLIVAVLAVVGLYYFWDLNQENLANLRTETNKARHQTKTELDFANNSLKKTFESANELNERMIKTLRDSIRLNTEINSINRKRQAEVYKAEAERIKAEADQKKAEEAAIAAGKALLNAKREAEKSRQEAEKQKKETNAERGIAANLRAESEALRKQVRNLKALRDENEQLRAEIKQRKDDTEVLSKRLAELQKSIAEGTGSTKKITKPQILLERYARNPYETTESDLSELIGVKVSALEELLKKDLGFHSWTKFDSDELVGVIREKEKAYNNLLVLTTKSQEVSRVNIFTDIYGFHFPSAKNLYSKGHARVRLYARGAAVNLRRTDKDTWTLGGALGISGEPTALFGTTKPKPYMTPAEYSREYPERYRRDLHNNRFSPQVGITLYERQLNFKVAAVLRSDFPKAPTKLRETIPTLFTSIVNQDDKQIPKLVSPSIKRNDLGALAAVLLKAVDRRAGGVVSIKKTTPASAATEPKNDSWWHAKILISYQDLGFERGEKFALLTMRYLGKTDEWILDGMDTDFSSPKQH